MLRLGHCLSPRLSGGWEECPSLLSLGPWPSLTGIPSGRIPARASRSREEGSCSGLISPFRLPAHPRGWFPHCLSARLSGGWEEVGNTHSGGMEGREKHPLTASLLPLSSPFRRLRGIGALFKVSEYPSGRLRPGCPGPGQSPGHT